MAVVYAVAGGLMLYVVGGNVKPPPETGEAMYFTAEPPAHMREFIEKTKRLLG